MMKKTLLTIGLATALAIPTGMAVASADDVSDDVSTTDDAPVTLVTADQTRERARLHEPGEYDGEALQVRERARVQDQTHAEDCVGDGPQTQGRGGQQLQSGAGDPSGMATRTARAPNGSPGGGFGDGGPMDGNGPLCDGPVEGAGY